MSFDSELRLNCVNRPSIVGDLHFLAAAGYRFPTVVADPPWRYTNTASRGAAENHYPTLTIEQICDEPIMRIADDNAHLHLWTTNAFLEDAFTVIRAWGFEYKSCMVWVKPTIGMGNYWRVSHEFLCDRSHKNSYVAWLIMLPPLFSALFERVAGSRTAHNLWSLPTLFHFGGSTMFEEIYKRGPTLERHENGPLATERKAFMWHLADHEYQSKNSLVIVACYLLVVAETLRLAERSDEKIKLKEIETRATKWSKRDSKRFRNGPCSDRARQRFTGFAIRWLAFMGRLESTQVPTTPYDHWLLEYEDFLRDERDLVESTIDARCRDVRRFLCRLNVRPQDLAEVSVDLVQRTLINQLEEANWKRNTVQGFIGALRGFFRYAERKKWAPPKLAEAIDSPRVYQHESIPSGPTWEQVQKLIATTDADRRIDIRDRAILLLLAVYGFRAGEVARLTLDSLNWHDEMLTLKRGRSGVTQSFPLCRSVGNAIARYLREGRAASPHRSLFLQYWRPLPLISHGVTYIVLKRLKEAKIELQRPGAHALRHACARHLLEQGLTMKEIGDHLGHQLPDTTRIYAKVNLQQLRRVANLDLGGVA